MSTRDTCFTPDQKEVFDAFYHPFYTYVKGLDLPDHIMRRNRQCTVAMKNKYMAAWDLAQQKFPETTDRMDYKEFKYMIHNLVEPLWLLRKLDAHSKLSGEGLAYLVMSRIKNERGSLERAMRSADISRTGGRPKRLFDKIFAQATEEEKQAAFLLDEEEKAEEPKSSPKKRRVTMSPPSEKQRSQGDNVSNKRSRVSKNQNEDGQGEKATEGASTNTADSQVKKEGETEAAAAKKAKTESAAKATEEIEIQVKKEESEDYVDLEEQLKELQQQHKILRKKHKVLKRKYAKLKLGGGKRKKSRTSRRAASK